MDFAQQLRILEAAQGQPALLALATVSLVHHSLPDAEVERLKQALLAAAVPHWCDSEFLAALLETTREEAEALMARLRQLNVIEPFTARGDGAVNVHEAARLALREHLRVSDGPRWVQLAERAAQHLADQVQPHARIEHLFHTFAVDPARAAEICSNLNREFTMVGHHEVQHAFALATAELSRAGWLSGAAEVEAKLVQLDLRISRGEAAQLEPEAQAVLQLAAEWKHPPGVANACCLLGDVLREKGRLDDALQAFKECLGVSQRLAAADAGNAGRQRDVAVAHSKVGDIYETQGRLDDALCAFNEDLGICQRLAAADASNASWQRELAIAHSKVGGIYQAQGRLDDALRAFNAGLGISQRLAAADAGNAGWQRDLAIAHSRIGGIYEAQGHLEGALRAFNAYQGISQRLAATDVSNASWQRGLAVAQSRVGSIYQAQGRLDDALRAFNECLGICQRLATSDASNAGWKRGLALAHWRIGRVQHDMGQAEMARASFEAAVRVMRVAVAMSPENAGWANDLVNIQSWIST